ncbi:MAG: GDP-mannose 4,6-dehydratase, partial [Actinomycetota bacterium]|nr:GDP-mannose 4,6-dehydratase [Actinomycetota bacterium]
TRDFVYVGDVVSAIMQALTSEASLRDGGGRGPAYNISTGTETSVETLAGELRSASAVFRDFDHEPAREGDIARSALDPRKARDVFAWSARVPLSSGLALTWRWFVRNA